MRTRLILLLGMVLVGALQAQAAVINLYPGSERLIAVTGDNSNLGSETEICDAFNLSQDCLSGATLLYKANVGGTEGGSLEYSYDTDFNDDASGGTVIHMNGPYAECPSCYLVVKDGNNEPAQFLFSLNAVSGEAAWDGTSEIVLSGFWVSPSNGAISNVAIWGTGTIPDSGTTLILLGSAILCLGVLRRRLRA